MNLDWRDCKYILPCGNCEKYDCFCKAAEYEMISDYKKMQEGKKQPEECEHEWKTIDMVGTSKLMFETNVCVKCNKKQIERLELTDNGTYDVTIYVEDL